MAAPMMPASLPRLASAMVGKGMVLNMVAGIFSQCRQSEIDRCADAAQHHHLRVRKEMMLLMAMARYLV